MSISAPSRPAAVLWDFDGTIVDTEPLWLAAERAVVARHGGVWTEQDATEHIGWPIAQTCEALVQALAEQGITVPESIEDLVQQMVDHVTEQLHAGVFTWRPGARELLLELHADRVPCALVSMSFRSTLEAVVPQLPEGMFGAIIAGDEVSRGKPDPEPYLLAAQQLGVDITDCIVLEDSIPGTRSGLASGAAVVAVENMVSLTPGGRSVVLPSLAGVGAGKLFELAPREAL